MLMVDCRMARIMHTAQKAMNHYQWRPLPPEVVNPEPSDFSSDSSDGEPVIIEVSSNSEIEDFVEFEPVIGNEGPKNFSLKILKLIDLGRCRELKGIIVIPMMHLEILKL
jgi:hypothetical protein